MPSFRPRREASPEVEDRCEMSDYSDSDDTQSVYSDVSVSDSDTTSLSMISFSDNRSAL